jgi:hypothetical protein
VFSSSEVAHRSAPRNSIASAISALERFVVPSLSIWATKPARPGSLAGSDSPPLRTTSVAYTTGSWSVTMVLT